jgi:hypothetical protein
MRTTAAVVASTFALFLSVACSAPADNSLDSGGGGDEDIPTLETVTPEPDPTESETPESESPAPAGATVTESMALCLADKGIPVTWDGEGEGFLRWDESYNWFVVWPDGEFSGEGVPPDDDPFWNDHQSDGTGTPPGLMIDGIDHSETLTTCLDATGYVRPQPVSDFEPSAAREAHQAQVDANNTWIACARDNGLPTIVDDAVPEDLSDPMTSAIVPLSTSVDTLRAVVDACPVFDEELATLQQDPGYDWSGVEPATLSVAVETPAGLEWPPVQVDPEATGELAAASEHWRELDAILREAVESFYLGG